MRRICCKVSSGKVRAEPCGVMPICGQRQNGWSAGSGSVRNTSSIAPPTWPLSMAASRSASTKCPPRATLMTYAPRCSCPSSWLSMMFSVSGVSGSRLTRMRVPARKSANCSAPLNVCTPSICLAERLHPSTGKPNCATALATRSPNTPRPMMPTGKSLRMRSGASFHSPASCCARYWPRPRK
ncbi:hypothetical protein D3C72_1605300 [compost metagenome]